MTLADDNLMLEADLERDRASLSSTLDELQDRFSFESLAEDAMGMVRNNLGGYVGAVDRAVRANPLALALIAGGIAWMAIGQSRAQPPKKPTSVARWEDEGGSMTPASYTPRAEEGAEWLLNVDSLRDRAREQLKELKDGAVSAMGQARDVAAEKATVLADLAQGMKTGFMHGLDDLSQEARDRIVTARKKAYSARLQTARAVKKAVRNPGTMIEAHPFVAGSIALAAGAALAAALPRTETEDRIFGSESDRLMNEASRVMAEERDRAANLAGNMTEELKETAKGAIDSMTTSAADHMREMADAGPSGDRPGAQG